jgi:hypothetical protein
MRFRLTAGLLAVAGVTACGGGGSTADTSTDTAGGGAPEEFGLSLADLTVRVEDAEQLIAQCVADAGFDYVAVDFVTIKQAMDSDQSAPGLSDDAYLAQYGLGITTQFDKPLVVFGSGPQNSAYLAGLPESDQVAFRRALWGEAVDWNHARALEEEDFSQTGGCTRAAADQLYSAGELSGTYINPADKLVEQDPRMIDAIVAWSDCMAAEGYDYTHPDQVDDDLTQRLDAIAQGQDPATLSGPDLEALHELQGEELAVAALLASCEEEHIEPVQEVVEGELYGESPT